LKIIILKYWIITIILLFIRPNIFILFKQ